MTALRPCTVWRPFLARTLVFALAVAWALLAHPEAAWVRSCATPVYVKYRDSPVCLDWFEFHRTERSSWIRGAWYDRKAAYLVIDLNGTLYHYCRLPAEIWREFKSAESHGRFYNAIIKGGYDCRLGGVPTYE